MATDRTEPPAAIRIEGLEKRFGEVRALDGLSLTVETGSVFGFLGPNGAGKTTTMRILTGLARASGGRAWVDGVEVTGDRSSVAAHIGFQPQDPSFYPWMTGRELLDHVGRVFGLPAKGRNARTEELLELVGLTGAADRRAGGYSGGMVQRLGIAQALVNQPPVLLLDEPVSSLDPIGRREVLNLIDTLRGSHTVFMSTHILADVQRVCDTVGIIHQGKIVAEAPQEELLERYAVPVFEIETERDQAGAIVPWLEALEALAWVDATTVSGRRGRVWVSDVEVAKRDLPSRAIAAGLILTRYEMVRPSLEDVFVKLVGAGEEGP